MSSQDNNATKVGTKQCTFYNSKAGCRSGARCRFQHNSPASRASGSSAEATPADHPARRIPSLESPASLELEAEMVKRVKVLTVDRRDSGGFSGYYSCSEAKEGQSRALAPAVAYRLLREDLAACNCTAVGVDLEGTSSRQVGEGGVALMVQVASPGVVVVEYPRGEFSAELVALLADTRLIKTFCGLEGDAKHFGPGVILSEPIADLEQMSSDIFGATKHLRGLSAILTLAEPSAMAWTKRSIKKERWWHFTNADQMATCKRNFARYAAADAWGTLLAFQRLQPLHAAAASAGTLNPALLPSPPLCPSPSLDAAPAPMPVPTAFSVSAIEVTNEQPPCRFFASSKGCRNGAACRFKHEE